MTGADALDQNARLIVATHIKTIADSEGSFEAWRAEEVASLLRAAPVPGVGFSVKGKANGPGWSGHAAGVGETRVPGDEKTFELGSDDGDIRCGAYVITKVGDRAFDIRHVTDVNADLGDGEIMRLCYEKGVWQALLNVPRIFSLGFVTFCLGGKFKLWKRGA